MQELTDPVKTLGSILRDIGAAVTVDTSRISRSTLYDFDYHMAVISCVFTEHGTLDAKGQKSVVAGWLKLMQFVAVRLGRKGCHVVGKSPAVSVNALAQGSARVHGR